MSIQTLVTEFPQSKRCERCDIILTASTYKDIQIAVSIRKNLSMRNTTHLKYECIRCATKLSINGNPYRLGIERVEEFLQELQIVN